MNRILVIIFFTTLLQCHSFAQECDLCRMWTGVHRVFTDSETTTDKFYIRIRKYGENYSIQVKEVYTDDGNTKTYYWNDCNSIRVEDNCIYWNSFSHDDEDWSGNSKSNGKTIDYAKYYKVCKACVVDAVLSFEYTIVGQYYDCNGNYIGEYNQPRRTYVLFDDDNDW